MLCKLAFLALVTLVTSQIQPPGCPAENFVRNPPIRLPDAVDCTLFYICHFGIANPQRCPGGRQWDTPLGSCEFPPVTCGWAPETPPPTTLPPPTLPQEVTDPPTTLPQEVTTDPPTTLPQEVTTDPPTTLPEEVTTDPPATTDQEITVPPTEPGTAPPAPEIVPTAPIIVPTLPPETTVP